LKFNIYLGTLSCIYLKVNLTIFKIFQNAFYSKEVCKASRMLTTTKSFKQNNYLKRSKKSTILRPERPKN
jgi:hypothetical protein